MDLQHGDPPPGYTTQSPRTASQNRARAPWLSACAVGCALAFVASTAYAAPDQPTTNRRYLDTRYWGNHASIARSGAPDRGPVDIDLEDTSRETNGTRGIHHDA